MNFLEVNAALIMLRCNTYLQVRGTEDSLGKYKGLGELTNKLDDSSMDNWAIQEMTCRSGQIPSDPYAARYQKLLNILDAGDVLRTVLDLSIAVFFYPEFIDYLKEFFDKGVNLSLAYQLEEISFPDEKEILKQADKLSLVFGLDLRKMPLLYQNIAMDDRVAGYLMGSDEPMYRTSLFGYMADPSDELHDAFIAKELIEAGTEFFVGGGKILQLSGRGGRRFIARHIAKNLGRKTLFLDMREVSNTMGENFAFTRNELIREAIFQDSGICLYGLTDELLKGGSEHETEILEKSFLIHILRAHIPVIMCCDLNIRFSGRLDDFGYRVLELKDSLSFDERKKLWQGFSSMFGFDINPEEAAMRYHLNASETYRMVRGLKDVDGDAGEDKNVALSRLALISSGIADSMKLGQIFYPKTRLGDVKMNPELVETIKNAIGSARIAHVLFDRWGLSESYRYGCAVSVLMSGPPGTGKTMTANAIAGELGIPLYQVNLSNIVDKYIGETEKNLEKVFSFAEKTNVVLFFDEADSLFGKRSEVKDSKDKYANNEISYLLQRMESYSGIVIMATNIKGNIDPAFMRRIRYVIHFDTPDADVRRQIWESLITDRVPHDNIDIDYLAEQFRDFTGSIIKTVFLNACARAAMTDGVLSMAHLIYAIKAELSKGSTVNFSVDMLGKYSYL